MLEAFMGEIILFAGNYAPPGWMFCNGQLLLIEEYSALFSIIGTTYGGNGTTNFALPDLRGSISIGAGQGPGLEQVIFGFHGQYFSSHGTQKVGTLGLSYCICVEGIFPSRE